MAKKYENIENIGKLISGGVIAELSKKVSGHISKGHENLFLNLNASFCVFFAAVPSTKI